MVCKGVSVSVAMFRYGVVVMSVFGCFRIPRHVAAGVAAGLVLVLAASACAPAVQDPPEPALVGSDRVGSDSVGPVLVDTVPEPSPTSTSVPVSDSPPEPAGSVYPSEPVVDPVPVAPVRTTTTVEPETTVEQPTTPEPTPTTTVPTTLTTVPTTLTPTTTVPTTPAPTTTVEPVTTIEQPTTPEPVTTIEQPTTPEPTTPTPVTPPFWFPPGVSGFPAPYPVPGTDPPPDTGVTVASITHHDAVWEDLMPEVTFRWTLHLSNGDNVERSWTPDPGYETTAWSPEWVAAGNSFRYSESWYWDSDPVYGTHSLQGANITRHSTEDTIHLNVIGSGNVHTNPGILPPSGYRHWTVAHHLTLLRQGPHANWDTVSLWYELWYALMSMRMQDQRDLYDTLVTYPNVPNGYEEPSERSDFLIEFLLTTQPRWSCGDPRTDRCSPPM